MSFKNQKCTNLKWYKRCNIELKLKEKTSSPLHEKIQLRIIPDKESGISEVRFWHEDEFLGSQKVKNSELNLVQP